MIYVMSDIHGNLRRYRSVMEQIQLQPEDTLYVLGDVMDRYPSGVLILRELMEMPNVKLLLGNHEYMMLQVMDPVSIRTVNRMERWKCRPRWYRNGGEVTQRALEALDRESREKLLAYVRALPLFYELERNGTVYRLIHAAPLELYREQGWSYANQTEFTVWHRWAPDEELPGKPGLVVIFGHSATCHFDKTADPMRIWYGDHRIGIDCGSGYPENASDYGYPQGRLACLRLDDGKEFYSEEFSEKP